MKHLVRWMFVVFVVGMHACMLLEVLDFPPLLGLLDAHALWHAATPPFVFAWYRMFAADAAWVGPVSGKLKWGMKAR